MFVCCFGLCCVGSGLSDGLITRPEECYRFCVCVCVCVWLIVCDLETSTMRRPGPLFWLLSHRKQYTCGKQSGTLVCPICLKIYLLLYLRFPMTTRGQPQLSLHTKLPSLINTYSPYLCSRPSTNKPDQISREFPQQIQTNIRIVGLSQTEHRQSSNIILITFLIDSPTARRHIP